MAVFRSSNNSQSEVSAIGSQPNALGWQIILYRGGGRVGCHYDLNPNALRNYYSAHRTQTTLARRRTNDHFLQLTISCQAVACVA